jgi:hypothetical protein
MASRAHNPIYLTPLNKNKIDYNQLTKNDDDLDVMTIPNALVSYCNKVLYSTYITLEGQLNQELDAETYSKLSTITQRVFDSWVTLGYLEGGETKIDTSNQ